MAEQFENYILVKDGNNTQRILLEGDNGIIAIKDANNKERINLDGGSNSIQVRDQNEKERIKLDGGGSYILLRDQNEKGRIMFDGGNSCIRVNDPNGKERIMLDGGMGDIRVNDSNGEILFHFYNEWAALYLGGKGNEGDLIVNDQYGKERIKLDGGGSYIRIKDQNDKERIMLDGLEGDIKLWGADCAENFDIAVSDKIVPGTVMVIDDEERLRPSENSYDTKVAGVVSGAKDLRPGIILGSEPSKGNRVPIALSGKVYCKVDAQIHAIGVGDLLTTSYTFGHAMKATDPMKAYGAVIGKALRPLHDGKGLIPILVSLH